MATSNIQAVVCILRREHIGVCGQERALWSGEGSVIGRLCCQERADSLTSKASITGILNIGKMEIQLEIDDTLVRGD